MCVCMYNLIFVYKYPIHNIYDLLCRLIVITTLEQYVCVFDAASCFILRLNYAAKLKTNSFMNVYFYLFFFVYS